MSDRLLGISPLVAGAGIVSLVMAIAFYTAGVGAWLPTSSIGLSEAESRARVYAAAQGFDVESCGAIVRPTWIDTANLEPFISRVGLERFRSAGMSGELPVPEWRVDFRQSLWTDDIEDDPGGLSVTMAGNGTILGAEYHSRRPRGEKLTRSVARLHVEAQLAAAGMDLAGFVERGDAPEQERVQVRTGSSDGPMIKFGDGPPDPPPSPPADTDEDEDESQPVDRADDEKEKSEHKFVFERSDEAWPGIELVVDARTGAGGLLEFERRISFSGTAALSSTSLVGQVIEGVAMFFAASLLVLILLGALVFRIITRDFVSIWRALLVAVLFSAVVTAYTIVTSRWSMPGIGVYILQLLASGSVGIVLIAAWLAGEADSYFAWGKQSTEGALALLTGRPHSRQVAREALEGTFWGWIVLAVVVGIGAVVAATLGPEAVVRRTGLVALDARPVWLFAIAPLPFVVVYATLFLLFLPAWIHRLTRRTWIAVPVAAVIAAPFASTMGLADLRFDVLPGSLSWGIVLSFVCVMLVVRRGVLTASMAAFTFSTFYFGIAALVTAAPGDRMAAAAGLSVFMLPAVAAVIAGPRLPEANVREAPPPRISAMMDQARRTEELDIARRVQAGLLPSKDPTVPGFDIAGTCLPANEVGGDYYDYFAFSDGRFGLAVGDVSGKGVPAAFCMTLTKGFMEVAAAESREPHDVLIAANGHLREYLARGTFVTMAYAVIDPESLTVDYARAGHNPPAVLRRGGAPTFVTPSGTALGAAEREQFAELITPERLELRNGDAIVLYTDGVTEAMNSSGEQFGEERLLETLAQLHDGRPARALADGLLAAVAEHARNAEQHDDITVVVVRAYDGGMAA